MISGEPTSSTPTPTPSPAAPAAPVSRVARAPFHVMTKPIGSLCNLACSYCFYLEKAHLYEKPGAMRMSPAVLEQYVRDYITAQPGPVVSFAWQGGEPTLLGLDYFRHVVELQKRHAGGKMIENAFQTNGVLVDDEWAKFFAENQFLVGISIDGPRELHDAYRVDKGQQPTFEKVFAGLQALKRNGVEFNTLTTLHRKNAPHPREVYRFLREHGSRFMQFIPIVERAAPADSKHKGFWLAAPPDFEADDFDDQVTPWSVRPVEFGNFLCGVFDEWIKQDVGTVFVQHFDSALANWTGQPAGICVFSENCGRALAVEHNGDVYSCDHYVYPEYRLGNLTQTPLAELVDSPVQARFGLAKSKTLPRYCRDCSARFACHGECPKHRFLRTPDGEPGLNYLCAGYKKFFRHIDSAMSTMAVLWEQQRAPAEIMSIPRSHWMPARRTR